MDRTGMDQIAIEDRTRLLSDYGPGYVSRAFEELDGRGGYQAHPDNALPSSDQRQAGVISPDPEELGVNQLPYDDAFRPGGDRSWPSSATTTTGAITRPWGT